MKYQIFLRPIKTEDVEMEFLRRHSELSLNYQNIEAKY